MSIGILIKALRSIITKKSLCLKLRTVPTSDFVILTYHRVLPESSVGDGEPGMYVTPTTLRSHIQFLKKYFDIVSVGQLEAFKENRNALKGRKPFCVLTFDDGWLDFYTHAWAVLKGENVPAIVYLPTALIGTKKKFWTDRVIAVIKKSGVRFLAKEIGSSAIDNLVYSTASFKSQLSWAIELLKALPYKQLDDLLNGCEKAIGLTNCGDSRSFMNWDEARELYRTGMVSFGSHTENHAILTTQSDDEIKFELSCSKQKILAEGVAGENISFCYPNGNLTEKIALMVAESGYSSAMTCESGWNYVDSNLFSLKRISLHQDICSSESLLAYRLARFL